VHSSYTDGLNSQSDVGYCRQKLRQTFTGKIL